MHHIMKSSHFLDYPSTQFMVSSILKNHTCKLKDNARRLNKDQIESFVFNCIDKDPRLSGLAFVSIIVYKYIDPIRVDP